MENEAKEKAVRLNLVHFLESHSLGESICNIDDIVLSYLLGIMELISEGEIEDSFGLEDVIEMMAAYLPGFEQIDRAIVMEWMFNLSSKLCKDEPIESEVDIITSQNSSTKSKQINNSNIEEGTVLPMPSSKDSKFPSYDFSAPATDISTAKQLPEKQQPSCQAQEFKIESSKPVIENIPNLHNQIKVKSFKSSNGKRKGRQFSISSQDSQEDPIDKVEVPLASEDAVRTLLEMFPASCSVEARHCLEVSGGDMEQAVMLIMDRQDSGQALDAATKRKEHKKNHKVKKTVNALEDDESIKSSVLQKYSFVDTEDDKRTHKPPPLKGEAKKLVRYRDGQVVSMKGERFSEVKKQDTEEMKATYVNLKPARKYRFH